MIVTRKNSGMGIGAHEDGQIYQEYVGNLKQVGEMNNLT